MRPDLRIIALFSILVLVTSSCSMLRGNEPAADSGAKTIPQAEAPFIDFQDVTDEVGAGTFPQRTWGSAWLDHDSSGAPDLFVNRHWADPQFLMNRGTSYEKVDIPALVGQKFDRHGCAWGEANGDGLPDLYCLQGADKGLGSGSNALLVQDAEGGFSDVALEAGIEDPLGRGRSLNWIDYDTDGDLDIFIANHERPEASNRLFRNDGGGSFSSVDVGLEDSLASISSSWADWDRDGDADLLVLQYGDAGPVAYENIGGRFEQTQLDGVTGRRWWSAAWGHADDDPWPDLHLVSPGRSSVLRNVRGSFEPLHKMDLNQGRMSAWLDAENDGDMDLYIVQGAQGKDYRPTATSRDARDILLENEGETFSRRRLARPEGTVEGNGDAVAVADGDRDGFVDVFVTFGHVYWQGISVLLRNNSRGGLWAAVDLQGPPENPLGIGAEVRVQAGDLSYVRHQTDGFNFRSQSEIGYVSLGLGEATSADVQIRWPGGIIDCVVLEAGEIIEVALGSHRCET